jgi:hypothetical protein
MGKSYRIKTDIGVDKNISLQLDQDFEFLEILSLQISQNDIYTRNCADYGVVVGRVVANGGLGIPNVKVSIFVPISETDALNEEIVSIYPYVNPNDKNDDGYRFNLLPYEPSYPNHAATGTFPTRGDVLKDPLVSEVYDKYYKYTVKTNESGDYMIFGVPLGQQTLFMDLDLSDIGEFSLTPQDLIRLGLATEAQVAGNRFRTSEDLDTLPQIVSFQKTFEVNPFWGDRSLCQVDISRVDFDLRDELNIDIQPTSVFIGSIFSTIDKYRIAAPLSRQNDPPSILSSGCKPKDNLGNLCELTPGPGQILAVRQTIFQDQQGRPVLEEYRLENSGNVIDSNGTWMIEVPMNLDYVTTAEDGTRIFSNDPKVGVPTKGKYRFKVKWNQSPTQTEQVKRPYFLIPNVREYGWTASILDPVYQTNNPLAEKDLKSSYYFGLDWTGYTDASTTAISNEKLQNAINCEDTFYEFSYNKVYTVSSLIDQYKRGFNRGRFVGIKEIDNNSCATTVNKFPVNEGFKNFDTTFFLFSILLQLFQIIFPPLLTVYHLLAALRGVLRVLLGVVGVIAIVLGILINIFAGAVTIATFGAATPITIPTFLSGSSLIGTGAALVGSSILIGFIKFKSFGFSMITYPDCTSCPCGSEENDDDSNQVGFGLLTPTSSNYYYLQNFSANGENLPDDIKLGDDGEYSDANVGSASLAFSETLGTNTPNTNSLDGFKTTESTTVRLPDDTSVFGIAKKMFSYSNELPLGARINLFNTRKKYFDGLNRISVGFDSPSNPFSKHYDNSLSVLSQTKIESGTLVTFVGYNKSNDLNFFQPFVPNAANQTFDEIIDNRVGITGTTLLPNGGTVTVRYANSQTTSQTQTYVLSSGTTGTTYSYPMDIEYYQVVTALTVSEFAVLVSQNTDPNFFSNLVLNSAMEINYDISGGFAGGPDGTFDAKFSEYFVEYQNQYVTILQRGVDPYSPKFVNKYGVGKLFGYQNEDDLVITATTRLNIPIQPLTSQESNVMSVQKLDDQNNIFYSSYFFQPGNDFSGFTTTAVGYYSALDASTDLSLWLSPSATQSNFGTLAVLNGWFNRPGPNGTTGNVKILTSKNSNNTYNASGQLSVSDRFYDFNEDVSGADFYWMKGNGNNPNNFTSTYLGIVYLPRAIQNPTLLNNKQKNVLRTDRLPSSDGFEGAVVFDEQWYSTAAILQQNTNFQIYVDSSSGLQPIGSTFEAAGADIVPPDIEDQDAATNVLETFTCNTMVPLACYDGNGTNFGVNPNCKTKDLVKGGCYRFRTGTPITTLARDLRLFSEWGLRYRFFYALCRGVLSQTFTNNWINGTLFAIPFQVKTIYKFDNTIDEVYYCKETFYYNDDSNNFYIRSSPYDQSQQKFIGKFPSLGSGSVNDLNLLYPTTIIDLGPKSDIYAFTTLDPQNKGFVVDKLSPTSAGDQSDLVNLFVISRITSRNFIFNRLLSQVGLLTANVAIDSLFSRDNLQFPPQLRVDGDLAQLMSINSEFGTIKFSPDVYNNLQQPNNPPIYFVNTASQNVMGVFFSSTTEDLQYKDFITPGRILFRPTNSQNAIPFVYGLKSQSVPFYRWKIQQLGNSPTIFGTQLNNWATTSNDIFSWKYQSLDRLKTTQPGYFIGSNTQLNDTFARGYIFNVNNSGLNSLNGGNYSDNFLVGAPNHFYFGLLNGSTALDRFRQKYLADE